MLLLYVTRSAKKWHDGAFFSLLLNIYNLHSQMYALGKFQPHMQITFGVAALNCSNNRSINLYNKLYKENTLQVLAKWLQLMDAIICDWTLENHQYGHI